MINTLSERKKIFSNVINAKPYFPSYLSESIIDETYEFMVSSRYDNATDEPRTGVMLSSMFVGDDDSESSFMISPEIAIALSEALLKAAKHAKNMDDIKRDLKSSKYCMADLINRKLIDKGKISIIMSSHDSFTGTIRSLNDECLNKLWGYLYDVKVSVFMKAENHTGSIDYELYDDSSFSFEVNLFKVLYSYAMNMLKNNLTDSKTLKIKNLSEPVPYFEVLKQFILMQIIKDTYINTDLYPEKELDELFTFKDDYVFQDAMDVDIEDMIEIVKEDLEQINKQPLNENNIKIVPVNTTYENDSCVSSKEEVSANTKIVISKY